MLNRKQSKSQNWGGGGGGAAKPTVGLGGVCMEGGSVGNRKVTQGWKNAVVQ